MPHHAAAAPSGAWFRPSVRSARPRAPRPIVPAVRPVPVASPPAPRLSWLARLERWCWRQEQARMERYLAGSADVAELEQRLERIARRPIPF
jgi:hypothetical protein